MVWLVRVCVAMLAAAGTLSFVKLPHARADEIRIDTDAGVRTAIALAQPRTPAPTILVLHGGFGTAEAMLGRSGFAEAAAKYGFAAVFPQGLDRRWNDSREPAGARADDVAFLRRLAGELVSRGAADPARLYIAGVSNGGMMVFRMLCEASELFAGAGTIIASMPASAGEGCRLKTPIAVVMFNGTADPLVPYEGGGVGFFGKRGTVWAAERTAGFLAAGNGCAGRSQIPLADAPGALRVTRFDWSNCSSGRDVAFYRVEGGGHQLYGRQAALPAILGPGTDAISAPEAIVAAFAREMPGAQWNSSRSSGGPTRQAP